MAKTALSKTSKYCDGVTLGANSPDCRRWDGWSASWPFEWPSQWPADHGRVCSSHSTSQPASNVISPASATSLIWLLGVMQTQVKYRYWFRHFAYSCCIFAQSTGITVFLLDGQWSGHLVSRTKKYAITISKHDNMHQWDNRPYQPYCFLDFIWKNQLLQPPTTNTALTN